MKKYFNNTLALLVFVVILLGCAKDQRIESVSSETEEGKVLVHLLLGGDNPVNESTQTRSFSPNDLIGVQIYEGSTPYAYGLYDDVSLLNFYLHSDKSYSFECAVVIDGKNKLKHFSKDLYVHYYEGDTYHHARFYFQDASRCYFSGYLMPFVTKTYSFTTSNKCYYYSGPSLNTTYYSTSNYFTHLDKGQITNSINSVWGKGVDSKPSAKDKYSAAEKLYGKVTNYSTQCAGVLNIELKRLSFGLMYSILGITDGNVSITIKNGDKTFISDSNISAETVSSSKVFAFYDGSSAYQYADNYAENFTVGVIWNRGVGVTQDLGTKTIQLRRNAINHVKINLNATTRSSNLSITLEEPETVVESYSFGN